MLAPNLWVEGIYVLRPGARLAGFAPRGSDGPPWGCADRKAKGDHRNEGKPGRRSDDTAMPAGRKLPGPSGFEPKSRPRVAARRRESGAPRADSPDRRARDREDLALPAAGAGACGPMGNGLGRDVRGARSRGFLAA